MGGRGRVGHDLLRHARRWGWTNPRLRVQQAAGLCTKAFSKELEQRECPTLTTPARFQFLFRLFVAVKLYEKLRFISLKSY
jgi:hypothetical protein